MSTGRAAIQQSDLLWTSSVSALSRTKVVVISDLTICPIDKAKLQFAENALGVALERQFSA